MLLAFVVYCLFLLDSIRETLTCIVGFSTITTICLIGAYAMHPFEYNPYAHNGTREFKPHVKQQLDRIVKWLRISAIIFIVSSAMLVFLPKQKTAWLMVGAYAGQQLIENQNVQKLSGKVLAIIEKQLDDYLEDLTVTPKP